jgi:hypothetical protein
MGLHSCSRQTELPIAGGGSGTSRSTAHSSSMSQRTTPRHRSTQATVPMVTVFPDSLCIKRSDTTSGNGPTVSLSGSSTGDSRLETHPSSALEAVEMEVELVPYESAAVKVATGEPIPEGGVGVPAAVASRWNAWGRGWGGARAEGGAPPCTRRSRALVP